jgi:hypothetical protein
MSSLRRVFAFLAPVLVTALAASYTGSAHAQALGATVTVPAAGVMHSRTSSGYRTNVQINYNDCITDDTITFSVNLANRGTYPLQIWAGNNSCTTPANRTTTTLSGCWLLYNALPTTNSFTVVLHVRDILWGQTSGSVTMGSTGGTGGTGGTDTGGTGGSGGTTDTGGTGGTTDTGGTTGTSTLPTGTLIQNMGPEVCEDRTGVSKANSLVVTFMLIDTSNANAVVGTSATWTAHYKLLAPAPPSEVSADVGDTLLPIHFSYPNNQSNDATINGYQFFCDPPPGADGAADAGAVAVPVETGKLTPNCQSSTLAADTIAEGKYRCGTASVSATGGNATGLVNGVSYNVGVSATDTFDNVGKLSALTCQVPQPVTGFFKAYRAAGGEAGGAFCSFSRKREPLPMIVLLGLASCLVLRRRRAA